MIKIIPNLGGGVGRILRRKNLQYIERVEIIVLDNQGAVHIPESGQISPGLKDNVDREDQADQEDENKVKEI